MLAWLRGRENPARTDARRLADTAVRAARRPALYGPGRVDDTVDGRFELAMLHAILAMRRLKGEPGAEPLAQAFSNRVFRSFDEGLREMGVGDLSVPRKMKQIAAAYFGRLKAYDDALTGRDRAALAEAFKRNIWNGADAPFAAELAAYAEKACEALAAAPLEAVFREETWPEIEGAPR